MDTTKTGEMIRALRKKQGMTQEQLAEVLGVSTAAVNKWENKATTPDIQIYPILARFFHVSIDFLMGFSNELSDDERKDIYTEVQNKLQAESPHEALDIWDYYIHQYPNDYQLKFELANLVLVNIFNLSVQEQIDFTALVHRLIHIFKQCTKSDDLTIKQMSYYQISNLYISIKDYEQAEKYLEKIPCQKVSPHILLNMIYMNKGEYATAEKNIQDNIFKIINEMLAELGHLIEIKRQEENAEMILQLLYKQRQILDIFNLTSHLGIDVILQIVLQLCEKGDHQKALSELKNLSTLLESRTNQHLAENDNFFTRLEIAEENTSPTTMNPAHQILLDCCLNAMQPDKEGKTIIEHLKQLLSAG